MYKFPNNHRKHFSEAQKNIYKNHFLNTSQQRYDKIRKYLGQNYFGDLMQRTDSLEKTLKLGKIGGKKRKVQQRMRWLDSITDLMDT